MIGRSLPIAICLSFAVATVGAAWADRAPEPAVVVARSLKVSTGLSRSEVRKVVEAGLRTVSSCKPSGAKDRAWSADISFSVLAKGNVVGVKVAGITAPVARCVERRLRRLSFSAPGRSVTVEGTWVFGLGAVARKASVVGVIHGGGFRPCPGGVCIDVEGGNDPAARQKIRKGLMARSKIGRCFRAKKSQGQRVELKLRIDGGGRARGVTIVGRKTAIGRCVARAVNRLVFPGVPASRAITVTLRQRVIGGLMGGRVGGGGWGYGIHGVGPGGGATGWGTTGKGKYGTIGRGGAWSIVKLTRVRATYDISAAVARRFVRRGLTFVRYCYQQELRRSPKLGGRVDVTLRVASDGAVKAVRARGMTNRRVRRCLRRHLLRIKFPAAGDHKRGQIQARVTFVSGKRKTRPRK